MKKIFFETPQLDELIHLHNAYWEAELQDQSDVLILDADEEETGLALCVSLDLPYRTTTDRYAEHVRHCQACLETPVWDIGCEYGARLAHIAADAMVAQNDRAAQN